MDMRPNLRRWAQGAIAMSNSGETNPITAERAIRIVGLFAILSIVLGFAMQGLIIFARMTSGGSTGGAQFVADLAHGVSWSALVCVGIGVATALVRARATIVGLVGLIAAPIGLAFAKSSQKVVSGIVGAAEQPAVLSLSTISLLRAVEYGLLGWALATFVKKGIQKPFPFLSTGLAVGLVFGGAIAALTFYVAASGGNPLPSPRIASTLVNEIAMPFGCSVVIYIGQIVSRSMRAIAAAPAT